MSNTPQRIIDAIDGALGDWAVSGDAMRWTPEPPPADDPAPVFPRAELRDLASGWEALRRAQVEFWASVRPAVQRFETTMRDAHRALADVGMLPDHPPTDPRARALWAARHRGTGPATPTAGKARRPRRHQ